MTEIFFSRLIFLTEGEEKVIIFLLLSNPFVLMLIRYMISVRNVTNDIKIHWVKFFSYGEIMNRQNI